LRAAAGQGLTGARSQELYTLALHHTLFGSGERDVLAMGSRSPEEVAQWRAALLRARDRGEASPAPAPAEKTAGEPPLTPRASMDGAGADAAHGGTPPPSGAVKARHSDRRCTIGHVPPELRDVQEIARRGPVPRVSAVLSSGAGGEDGAASEEERGEGPSVVLFEGATWRLCALENGLRFFEDGSGTAGSGWAAAPCTKVAGRVRAPSDVIFKLVMDLGRSREEWDCTFASGSVLEQLDGHTEVVHTVLRSMRLASAALPSRPRDLVMTRYWRREEDGTYMILFRSTEHASCPPVSGVVRAEVACGCYIITPLPPNNGHGAASSASGDSLVMYLLETSPRGWMLPFTGLPRAFQRSLLMNVAGIRDFFEQLSEKGAANFETGLPDPLRDLLDGSDDEGEEDEDDTASVDHRASDQPLPDAAAAPASPAAAAAAADSAAVASTGTPGTPQASMSPNRRASAPGSSPLAGAPSSPLGANSVEPTPSFQGLALGGGASLPYGVWPPPKGQRGINCWCAPVSSRFVVRSGTYLTNGVKCPAGSPLRMFVASDWLVSEDRIDNICSRPDGALKRGILPNVAPDTHVFCVNLQVPGAKPYSIIFYFVQKGAPARDSVLGKFWHGDDAYRAPRFKLIPAITEGAWVVQRSVGTKPLIVGNALKTTYYGGGDERYLEVDVDIGSSSVANSVTRFVMAYLRTLVIDLAFLVESKSEAELPERVLGTIRVCHLDPDLVRTPKWLSRPACVC
jgi:hypothetical protein